MSSGYRLAVLTSHPIQYQAPFFRHLAARPEVELTVFFCSDHGLKAYEDPGFGTRFQWDVPLIEGYRHEFLRNRSPRPQVSRFWGSLNPDIRQRLREGRFDAVVIHGWALATNWLAVGAARRAGLPIFLRGETNGLNEPTGFRLFVKRHVLTRLFHAISGFLAIGTLNRRFYESYGVEGGRIFHAPYSVDNVFFQNHAASLLPERSRLRAAESIPDDAVVFLFCGKLIPLKRPLELLEAFARLPDVRGCQLIYAGDGALRGKIEHRVRELGLANVRITGFLNQSELPKYYAMADALVLPSAFEPWGLVVNEAMNFGLPMVVSDHVGAAPDLVRPGENGFIVPAGDTEALAVAMSKLAGDRAAREAMGKVSRQLVAGWGIAETADGYLSALRQVAGPAERVSNGGAFTKAL